MGTNRIIRKEGWETRLYQTIEEWRDRPFEWGKSDCVAFSQSCLVAMSGDKEPIVDLGGENYKDAESCDNVIKENFNKSSLEEAVRDVLNLDCCTANEVTRGDLAFYQGAVGIVDVHCAWFIGKEGLFPVPKTKCSSFYKVV